MGNKDTKNKKGPSRQTPGVEFRAKPQGFSPENDAVHQEWLMQRAWQVVTQTPEVRPAKVAALLASLAHGSYRVEARELTHRLLPREVLVSNGPGWPLDYPDLNLAPLLAHHPSLVPEVLSQGGSTGRSVREAIGTLIMTLEAVDCYSGLHSARVTGFALGFARYLELPPHDLQSLKTGGYLHDIGKVVLNHAVLRKPGEFTLEERAAMQTHPGKGGNIVAPLGLGEPEREIILLHHERWDGRGYPLGLSGERIPLLCRLMALADVFDALTSDRPYRHRLSVPQALATIQDLAGVQFDPHLVSQFVKMMSSRGQIIS